MRAGSVGLEAIVMGVDLALKLVAFCVRDGAVTFEVAVLQSVSTGTCWLAPPVD